MTLILHGNKNFDKKYFHRFFNRYDRSELNKYSNWFWGWFNFIDRFVPLKDGQGKKVLEIGSSIGAFAKILKEKGYNIVASDISSFIVEKASRLQKKIIFKVINVEKGITISGPFDYIFCFDVVEHLKRPESAFRNIIKKLKKGGIFIFSTPFPSKEYLSDPTHINVHEADWWIALGKKTGFTNLRFSYATFIPFLYRINKNFSVGFPLKVNFRYLNSTCLFFFKK